MEFSLCYSNRALNPNLLIKRLFKQVEPQKKSDPDKRVLKSKHNQSDQMIDHTSPESQKTFYMKKSGHMTYYTYEIKAILAIEFIKIWELRSLNRKIINSHLELVRLFVGSKRSIVFVQDIITKDNKELIQFIESRLPSQYALDGVQLIKRSGILHLKFKSINQLQEVQLQDYHIKYEWKENQQQKYRSQQKLISRTYIFRQISSSKYQFFTIPSLRGSTNKLYDFARKINRQRKTIIIKWKIRFGRIWFKFSACYPEKLQKYKLSEREAITIESQCLKCF